MDDPLDEIMARYEAATTCCCSGCCDDDFSAYVEQKTKGPVSDRPDDDLRLSDSASSQRGSVRYVFEAALAQRDKN